MMCCSLSFVEAYVVKWAEGPEPLQDRADGV
jgi:hypothetical protein